MFEPFEEFLISAELNQESEVPDQDFDFNLFEQQKNLDQEEMKEQPSLKDQQIIDTVKKEKDSLILDFTRKKRIVNTQGSQFVKQELNFSQSQISSEQSNNKKKKTKLTIEDQKDKQSKKRTRELVIVQDSKKVEELKKELSIQISNNSLNKEQKKKVCLKIKNKIFAQQSRDRKQAYVDQLEKNNLKFQNLIKTLQDEITTLKRENSILKQNICQDFSRKDSEQDSDIKKAEGMTKVSFISFTFVSVLSFIWMVGILVLDDVRDNDLIQNSYSQRKLFQASKYINPWYLWERLQLQDIQTQQDQINNVYRSQLGLDYEEQEIFQSHQPQFLDFKINQTEKEMLEKNNKSSFDVLFYCNEPQAIYGRTQKQVQLDFSYIYIPEAFFASLLEKLQGFIFRVQNIISVHDLKDVSFFPVYKEEQ